MKAITVRDDGADLDITLDELIVIRNSLNQVLSIVNQADLHAKTGFHPQEIKTILNSVEQIINELQ